MNAGARLALAAAVSVGALHARPMATAHGPLRRFSPRFVGRGRTGGVALTFDDGPDPLGTPAVLSELERLGWTATFFLLGSQVRAFADTARRVAAAGHEIAVHGDLHRSHLIRTPRDVRRDMARALADISEVTGSRPRWYRAPYGHFSAGTMRAAAALGLEPIVWTAWGCDWRAGPADEVLRHVVRGLDDGGTVLLHDSDCTSAPGSWRTTVAALPLLAAEFDRRGLAVRPLRDHLPDRK
jgi:peptidoglycan/xylan/chitin deacetylase (PgdA/CDA1 family)